MSKTIKVELKTCFVAPTSKDEIQELIAKMANTIFETTAWLQISKDRKYTRIGRQVETLFDDIEELQKLLGLMV
jgi:hypothetical protein